MAAASSTKTREVLVVFTDGTKRKVGNIPQTAKITFGPLTPGAKSYDNPTSLRIYTTTNNQLAVFVGVREFRDLSLDVQEEHVEVEYEGSESHGPQGGHVRTARKTTRDWKESF